MPLFTPITIGDLELPNRLVRSATWEGLADDAGTVTEPLLELYRDLAAGGVGLIVSGFTNVLAEGNAFPGTMGLWTDNQQDGLARLVATVHAAGGRLCVQLGHGGGQASSKTCGGQPLAPCDVKVDQFPEQPRAMTEADIERTIAAFAAAAKRAAAAGADAVQLHAAHGYLINQFLSPHTNRRTDAWGGALENRARFLLEVVQAARAAIGDLPLLVKLNGSDNLEGGLSPDEARQVAVLLDGAGIDAIEISSGTPASGAATPVRRPPKGESITPYNLDLAQDVHAAVDCPVIAVGGFRRKTEAEAAVGEGRVDLVSLCRPLISEPDLPDKWRTGTKEVAACISCNGCFKLALRRRFGCVLNQKETA
ncbi:MAG: NADH:flavin oxidoreductase [Geothermobacteraceae bacterium]